MSLPVAILAGGQATRLGTVSQKVPKSLLDVSGRPFAVHQLELLKKHGLTRVVFCVGYLGAAIVTALGDGRRWGMDLKYSFDGPVLLGTGGALRKALPLLDEAFFVMYGDSYLDCDYRAVETSFLGSGKAALMTVFRNCGQWDRSNVWFEDGEIREYDKRSHSPAMKHIDYGLGVLRSGALAAYPADAAFDLADVYQDQLSLGQLTAFEVAERFYEIGSPAGLAETRRHLAEVQ